MYDEILDDPKVQLLSPELFRTWVNLLALACRNDGVLPPVGTVSFALRISTHDAQSRIDDLILAGLIDIRPDSRLQPHNWPNRQFTSDSSTERVRKFRAKRSGNVSSDVSATAPDPYPEGEESKTSPSEQVAAREVDDDLRPPDPVVADVGAERIASLRVGLGLGGEPSVEAKRKVCREHGLSDAEPLVDAYRAWKGSRTARDPDAKFIASARTILAKRPEVRAACRPIQAIDDGIAASAMTVAARVAAERERFNRRAH
jgi:hypothetical protein